jgi:hypothetical protein
VARIRTSTRLKTNPKVHKESWAGKQWHASYLSSYCNHEADQVELKGGGGGSRWRDAWLAALVQYYE